MLKNGCEAIRTMSKKELCRKYGICIETLNKWLSLSPEIEVRKEQRILTPAQIRLIYDKIGEP